MTASAKAERLRRARTVFERAIADRLTMAEAKRRIESARVELRRRTRAEVGRWRDAPAALPHLPVDDSDDGLKWFQR